MTFEVKQLMGEFVEAAIKAGWRFFTYKKLRYYTVLMHESEVFALTSDKKIEFEWKIPPFVKEGLGVDTRLLKQLDVFNDICQRYDIAPILTTTPNKPARVSFVNASTGDDLSIYIYMAPFVRNKDGTPMKLEQNEHTDDNTQLRKH